MTIISLLHKLKTYIMKKLLKGLWLKNIYI